MPIATSVINYFNTITRAIAYLNNNINKALSKGDNYTKDYIVFNSCFQYDRQAIIPINSLLKEYADYVLFSMKHDDLNYIGMRAIAEDINGFAKSCIKHWVKLYNKKNMGFYEVEYISSSLIFTPCLRESAFVPL